MPPALPRSFRGLAKRQLAPWAFGDLEGHTLVIFKALYGLRSSGLRWHERFADCLRDMGFTPSKAEPDIWMRPNGDAYEYIGVYVDDLAIVARNPGEIIDTLQTKHCFKLKGTGPIMFQGGHGAVAYSNIKISPLPKP
mgnify:CR=1 FL=1